MIHHVIPHYHSSAVVAALLILSCSAPPPVAETPEKPPNFIIIMADDLGYGDLSTYGGWIDVPSIDRLAAEGLKFTDFHSNGAVCSPTRAALLTGRYQQRVGIPMVVFADPKRENHRDGLQPIEYTFAEMLKEQGYATGIVGKWHLGYYPNYNPIHSGFDLFRGYVSGNVDFFSHVDQAGTFDWWHQDEKSDEKGYVTTLINRHAVRFIEDNEDRPFCLYIPHEAPHSPYQGPGDDPAGFRVAGGPSARLQLSPELTKQKYAEMVVEMDRGVGAVMDAVERTGISDHTLIFFFSDNGATRRGSNGLLRGHKASVWEGGHRVPAIARWPGKIQAGTVSGELAPASTSGRMAELAGAPLPAERPLDGVSLAPVLLDGKTLDRPAMFWEFQAARLQAGTGERRTRALDSWPTMAELAGAPLPAERPLDGVSLAPVLLDGKTLDRPAMFWEFQDAVAMRDGPWKYIAGENDFAGPGLFNLADDLGEQTNLASKFPDRTKSMAEAVAKWLQEVEGSATEQPSTRK